MTKTLLFIKDYQSESVLPEQTLFSLGYQVFVSIIDASYDQLLHRSDRAVLYVPENRIHSLSREIRLSADIPLIWWCPDNEERLNSSELILPETDIDGLICSTMSVAQIAFSIHLACAHHSQRSQWKKEREEFASRLMERKWIDQAKAILSEIKNISEAEAYEFLRKQAMNERKKMVDVASSIVKVYQLLRERK